MGEFTPNEIKGIKQFEKDFDIQLLDFMEIEGVTTIKWEQTFQV